MTQTQKLAGLLSTALCLSLIACGGSQERTKIGDRRSARDQIQNSKLLKADVVIKSCPTESGKTEEGKEILSLDGLSKGLTTADADTLFASSFTSRIQITGENGDDLKNKKLSQTYLLEYGLQYNSATLKDIAPSLLDIVHENCERVVMPLPSATEEPSLFFQMARLDMQHLSTFSKAFQGAEETATEEETAGEEETTEEESPAEEATTETIANGIEFIVDLDASSRNMLVLIHPDGNSRIIVKLVGDETLQVITEKPDALTACGETYRYNLRNEATLVWGKSKQEPVTIDYELYQTMLDLSNNNELLSNGVTENKAGRRAEGSTVQSVSLPDDFIGSYDEAINKFHNSENNVFDIQPVACGVEETPAAPEEESAPEEEEEPAPEEGESTEGE